ncbi:MAG: hypothetical protein IT221_02890 [Fluviicola sp.]|nr:hypothetical protein [Fluviicola sp.]
MQFEESMKKNSKLRQQRIIGVITFVSLILILWEMMLFRKTFVPFYFPLLFSLIGGLLLFLLLRKKINYYVQSKHPFWQKALHGIIMFGGILGFLLLSINYYFPTDNFEKVKLKILEIGTLTNSKNRCEPPFVLVSFKGHQKQIVFPCHFVISNPKMIELELQKGSFGFYIIEEKTLIYD